MAYIRRRLGSYQVMVRRRGHAPSSKTFRKLADAKAWARKIESEMERGVYLDISKARLTSVSDLLDRFEQEVLVRKKDGAYREKSRLKLLRAGFGSVMLSDLAPYHLKGYERQRERCVGPQAIRHEIGLLRRALNTGIKEWGINLPHGNPVCLINLPTNPPGRDRRLQGGEEGKLLHTLKHRPEIQALVQLALETG